MELIDKPVRGEISDSQSKLILNLENLWEGFLKKELKRVFDIVDNPRDENTIFYLAYKTLKICSIYPYYMELAHFDKLFAMKEPKTIKIDGKQKPMLNEDGSNKMWVKPINVDSWLKENKDNILKAIKEIYQSTDNHITVKVHQCLDYLKEGRYKEDFAIWDVDEELLKGAFYDTYDDMMRLLPPPFFITEVSYRKKPRRGEKTSKQEVTLQSMSSGERQILYSLSYIYYHIKNIASINENGRRVVGYHHVNLIFDEAELYYHPEFQRQYITRLLGYLAMCNINRTNIRSINIIIITHSPFILSDLPESNILFLKKGDDPVEEVPQKTLGANIYDLLKSSFFLEYAIGDVVQQKLQQFMDVYYKLDGEKQKKAFLKDKEEFKFTIEHLGEDYLNRSFQYMYDEMERNIIGMTPSEQIVAKINKLQSEMDSLKAQIKDE